MAAVAALLRSCELQLTNENYAFSLAYWWYLEQQQKKSSDELQQEFNFLLKCLPYGCMSCPFLASIVHIDAVKKSGLVPSIMSRAIWRRGMADDSYRFRGDVSSEHTLPSCRLPSRLWHPRAVPAIPDGGLR